MRKVLPVAIFFAVLLLGSGIARAQVQVFSYTSTSTSDYFGRSGGNPANAWFETTSSLPFTLQQVKSLLTRRDASVTDGVYINLYKNCTNGSNCGSGTFIASSSIVSASTLNIRSDGHADFDNHISLFSFPTLPAILGDNTTRYDFEFRRTSTLQAAPNIYDIAKYTGVYASYVKGNTCSSSNNDDTFCSLSTANVFYIIGYSTPYDSISITYPISTSTPIGEFSNWTISFQQATSTTASSADFYTKQIYEGATSTAINTLAGNTSVSPDLLPSPAQISKPFALGTGTFYAQAQLRYFKNIYDQYGTLVATSSIISFTINQGFGASGSWSSPTSTATSTSITCDSTSGAFAYSLCFLAQALFIPSSDATNEFQNIGNLVSSKPPMGYFNQIKAAINSLSTNASSTFVLANLTSMNTTLITPIKTMLQLALWFVFGFWLFHRARHLQL